MRGPDPDGKRVALPTGDVIIFGRSLPWGYTEEELSESWGRTSAIVAANFHSWMQTGFDVWAERRWRSDADRAATLYMSKWGGRPFMLHRARAQNYTRDYAATWFGGSVEDAVAGLMRSSN